MEHIKTFPKGSTVVLLHRGFNRKEYRTCSPGGGLCTYNACLDRAIYFAQVYEDYYNHKPLKRPDKDVIF
jgi:hypothetical protein